MRDALVSAAKAQPGVVSALILKADKRIKRPAFGGWFVNRAKKERKRGRRSR